MDDLCALGVQRQAYLRNKRFRQSSALLIVLGSVFTTAIWFVLFSTGRATLDGIPYSVFVRFWQDQPAREAYFSGDRTALHDRLSDLGVEYEIKRYYRSQINNPVQLDQHIHQILYNHVRYVGEDYSVEDGKLKLKTGRAGDIVVCPSC